jgi:hypothetical protein
MIAVVIMDHGWGAIEAFEGPPDDAPKDARYGSAVDYDSARYWPASPMWIGIFEWLD